MTCPESCVCGGWGGPVLVSGILTKDLLSGKIPKASWICHTCKKKSPADGINMPDHFPNCQWLQDEVAWQNAWHNSQNIPNEYPHARDWTNVGKYFWRKALEYERTRKKEKNQWP